MFDLKVFCMPKGFGLRFDLTEPFILDGYKYCTDGRIAVRIKTDELDTQGRILPKNIMEIFEEKRNTMEGEFSFSIVKTEEKCKECYGKGRLKLSKDFSVVCDECDGKGKILSWGKNKIGEFLYSDEYIDKICDNLDNSVITGQSNDGKLFFKFNGGDGVLMNTN